MQAIEGNTVEIYLQTEWKRSYTGYTQPVNGRFILNATQVVINVCICLMCVCMSSLVCIHACAVSRRFASLRVFVFALKHPALTFANTHTRTRKQAVVGDVVRISGRVPPRLFFGKWREHLQYSTRASRTNSGSIAGDDKFSFVDVTVTSYSAAHDWFRGYTKLRHTYPSANSHGWEVTLRGCCRIANVLNNAGLCT